jgi:hypothetical protein
MVRFVGISALLLSAFWGGSSALGAVFFSVPSITLEKSQLPFVGKLEVSIKADGVPRPRIFGYDVTLQAGPSDFLRFLKVENVSPSLGFETKVGDLIDELLAYASIGNVATDLLLPEESAVMEVSFEISADTPVGTVIPVFFVDDPNAFFPTQVAFAGQTSDRVVFENGTITVVPEAGSAVMAASGLLLVLAGTACRRMAKGKQS